MGFVLISFLPGINQLWKSQNEKKEKIEKIDNEISSRFDQLINITNREVDSSSRKPSSAAQSNSSIVPQAGVDLKLIIFSFIMAPGESKIARFYPLYQEYNSYGIIPLMSELAIMIDDTVEKNKIRLVIRQIETYSDIPLEMELMPHLAVSDLRHFIQPLYLARWQK